MRKPAIFKSVLMAALLLLGEQDSTVRAELYEDFCPNLSTNTNSDVFSVKFGPESSSDSSQETLSSLDSIAADFKHNMRPSAFQCCRDAQGFVHGLKLKFKTMQNHSQVTDVPYFVADKPLTLETNCIGPDCSNGCSEFVEVQAFPWNAKPITAFTFDKDVETGYLRQVYVKVQGDYQICGDADDSMNTNTPAITRTQIDVTDPIVGFEYTETSSALTSLRLVMNTCSVDSLAAFELDIGEVPEPIMIQLEDFHNSQSPFSLEIELPKRPEMFSHTEYGQEDPGLDECFYALEGSALTRYVPNYVRVVEQNGASILQISKEFSGSKSPTGPKHDILRLYCHIGSFGNNHKTFSRTIEIMFYEFDYDVAQDDHTTQCFYMLAKMEDPFPIHPEAFAITDKYRYFETPATIECCLNEGSLSSIRTSYDGSNYRFKDDEQACHVTEGIKLKDYLNYGVLTGADGYVKDVLFNKGPFEDQDYEPLSLCGRDRQSMQKDIADGRFDQYEQAVDGRFVMFFHNPFAKKIELLGIIANRCLVTPEFAQFPQPEIIVYDINDYTDDMSEDRTITFSDPYFPNYDSSLLKPTLKEAGQGKVFMGWQPPKSLVENPDGGANTLRHAKNIDQLVAVPWVSLLKNDVDSSFIISGFNENLAGMPNQDLSYLVYKKFTYQSALVTFEIQRLAAIVQFTKQEEPDLIFPDPLDFDEDQDQEEAGEDEKDQDCLGSCEEDVLDQDQESEKTISCELEEIYLTMEQDYYIEDNDGQVTLHLNPVFCRNSAGLESLPNGFYHENLVFARIDSDNIGELDRDELLTQIGPDEYIFQTYDSYYIDRTAVFTQVTNLYSFDEESGIESRFDTLVFQLAEFKIKTRCEELNIMPQDLKLMHMEIGTDHDVSQKFWPLRDILGMPIEGNCGTIERSLTPTSPGKALPSSVLYLDGYTIRLIADGAEEFVGFHTYQINFYLVEHSQWFFEPFSIIIQERGARTDHEIRAAINIVPEFYSFKPGKQSKLPGVTLMVGQPYTYELPRIKEWNEDDKVLMEMKISNSILRECNCITLVNQEAISIDLPEAYTGLTSTIEISLSDGLDESVYNLVLAGRPFDPSTLLELDDDATTSGQWITAVQGPAQQIMLQSTIWGEEVDSAGEEESNHADLDNYSGECIPVFTRIGRDGHVLMKFSRKLVITSDVDDLMEKLVTSGSIQVQMIDEGPPQASMPNKAFTWSVLLGESEDELLIQVQFEDPNAISSTSNQLDKLRVNFIDTREVIRCESAEEQRADRRLQAQQAIPTDEKDLIPSDYKIIVQLPQQMTSDQFGSRQKVIDDVEEPAKTYYFASIALVTMSNLSLQTLWGSINALQIIAHIPLNNVNFPSNCYFLFQFLADIVAFDLFAPTDHYDFGFTETGPINYRFDDLGYETSNYIENLGSIGLIAVLMACRMILLPLVLWIIRYMNFCRCCRRMQRRLETNGAQCTNSWVRFGVQAYFELIICSLVGFRLMSVIYKENANWQDRLAEKFSYLSATLCALFVIFVGYMSLIHIRGYVSYKKSDEVMSLAKCKQQVYQNQKFQKMLDYGPNIFFEDHNPDDVTLRSSGTDAASQVKLKMPLPRRHNVVLIARPADLKREVQPKLGYHAYFKEVFRDLKPYRLSAMPFFFCHLVRRIVFVFVAFYLSSQPFLQILCYLIQSILMLSYLASYRPFANPSTCKLEIFNEFVVLLVGYNMITIMSTGNLNAEKMSIIGISLITLIIALCSVNTLKFVYEMLYYLILNIRRLKTKKVGKKRTNAYKMQQNKSQSQILERLSTGAAYERQTMALIQREIGSEQGLSDQYEQRELDEAFNQLDGGMSNTMRKIEKAEQLLHNPVLMTQTDICYTEQAETEGDKLIKTNDRHKYRDRLLLPDEQFQEEDEEFSDSEAIVINPADIGVRFSNQRLLERRDIDDDENEMNMGSQQSKSSPKIVEESRLITLDKHQYNTAGFVDQSKIPVPTIYSCPGSPRNDRLMIQESCENMSFSRMHEEEDLPNVRRSAAPTIPHHTFLQQLKDEMRTSCSPDLRTRRESNKMLLIQVNSPDRESERDLLEATGNTGSVNRNRENSMLSLRPILIGEMNSEINTGVQQLIKGNQSNRQSISDTNTNGTTTVGSFVGLANSNDTYESQPHLQQLTPSKQPSSYNVPLGMPTFHLATNINNNSIISEADDQYEQSPGKEKNNDDQSVFCSMDNISNFIQTQNQQSPRWRKQREVAIKISEVSDNMHTSSMDESGIVTFTNRQNFNVNTCVYKAKPDQEPVFRERSIVNTGRQVFQDQSNSEMNLEMSVMSPNDRLNIQRTKTLSKNFLAEEQSIGRSAIRNELNPLQPTGGQNNVKKNSSISDSSLVIDEKENEEQVE